VTVSGEGHGSEQFAAVIIATGAAARLSYSLNIDGLPTKAMAFRGYAPNPRKCDALQFEFNGESITQYRWAFPVGDKSNVGAFRVEQAIREPQAALRALAGRVRGTEKLAGGIEPLWSAIANNWHHEWGIVSCGDCAGLVDPITGEGITAAFVSGEMAAVSIAEYLNERRVDALERFSLRIKEVFSTKYNNYRAEDFLALFSPVG
jgi:flavin-dependent dehydrogenase